MDTQFAGLCSSDTIAILGFALWAISSEIIGMSKLKSNGTIQLALTILMKAFPRT